MTSTNPIISRYLIGTNTTEECQIEGNKFPMKWECKLKIIFHNLALLCPPNMKLSNPTHFRNDYFYRSWMNWWVHPLVCNIFSWSWYWNMKSIYTTAYILILIVFWKKWPSFCMPSSIWFNWLHVFNTSLSPSSLRFTNMYSSHRTSQSPAADCSVI